MHICRASTCLFVSLAAPVDRNPGPAVLLSARDDGSRVFFRAEDRHAVGKVDKLDPVQFRKLLRLFLGFDRGLELGPFHIREGAARVCRRRRR